MQKVHQLSSGTIKFESGKRMVIDDSKSLYIKNHFKGKKLAIFYKFIAELEAIKLHNDVTDNIEEFNNSNKHIALQIVSGREGINLSKADYIVYYNIDFSAVSYWQSRDRMTTKERFFNNVYWLFSDCGIENKIYKAVANKKDYTLQTFKKDDRATVSKEVN
jgi:DNA-binding transcriptional regulator YiaG